jgi:hypothetical protein
MAKQVMIKYFDFCDKNNIKIYYCNTDSILNRETDIKFITQFLSDSNGDLKVEGKYNNANNKIFNDMINKKREYLFGSTKDQNEYEEIEVA